ncbi:MAG: hypothetical protein K6G42_06405, partial [Lachnospiraceae bacterium]|nr:hypothetical protein [Lachnospiraceae bacterium]
YDWRIYTDNTCKDNVTQIKHISNKTNKFNPKLQLNENEKAQLKEGKTYFVKCIITETWEGTHSYTVNATGTGYFKMVPYLPPVEVGFEQNIFKTDLTLELGVNCDPSYLNYQKKKGYIGEYEYIVKNETSGVVYENTSTDYSDIIVPETEMKKSAVGFIDVSVEVVLYRDAEKNEKLTTDGQFKKTVTVGYLPLVTSLDDNDAAGYDKDTALGKIRFIDLTRSARIQINGSYVNADEYGITDGLNFYSVTSPAMFKSVTRSMGSSTYMSYAKTNGTDGKLIFSLNSFEIKFDDPDFNWETDSSVSHQMIKTDTVFNHTDKLTATVTIEGTSVSDPRMLWSVVGSEGNIVKHTAKKNRYDAGTTTPINPGTKFKSEISLDGLITTVPQNFPEGDVTFRCELYNGNYNSAENLVTYTDITVNFSLGYNEYHLWAMRNGKMTDVTDSWLYIDDEESNVTIEVRGNPEFTNLQVLDTYQIGDGFKPTVIEDTAAKKVSLGEKDKNGRQVFSFWTRASLNTYQVTLCHPQTDFAVVGVDEPEIGKRLDETKAYVPEGANYTADVYWLKDGNDPTYSDTVFLADHVYTAVIMFIPDEGMILPVTPYGNLNYPEGSRIFCLGNYGTGYGIIGRGPSDGFGDVYFEINQMPACDGTKIYGYRAEYKTFPRLIDPEENVEYIDRLDITYDVPQNGDAESSFSLSVEPAEAILKGEDGKPSMQLKLRCGGSSFSTFETGKVYSCEITYLNSAFVGGDKTYYFADDMSIFVNDSMLFGSSVNRERYNATKIDSISFTFVVPPKAKIIDSYGIDDIPEVVVGDTADRGFRMYDDRYRVFYHWFEDKDGDGVFKSDELFDDDFEEGKVYGVHIYMDVDNFCYRFADQVTIHCNGVTKDAQFEGDVWTYADFIMNGGHYDPVIISSFGFGEVAMPVAGNTVPEVEPELYDPADTKYSPKKYLQYFVDLDGSGTANSSDEWDEIENDGHKFVDGKTYGVSVWTNITNERYSFDDEVAVTCNDRTKSATISGTKAHADFILNGAECTHESMTPVPAEDSTCSKHGHVAYYVCDKCGTWFEEDRKTEIADHSTVKLPKKDHTPGEPVKERSVPARCTTDGGFDEAVYCKVCTEEISRVHHIIPALGHDFGEWKETKAPTAGTDGQETRVCDRCDITETRSIPYLGKPLKIGSSTTDDYPSIADAMKDINKAIKAKTAEADGYNLIVGDEHTEKKAVSFPKSTTKFAITGGRLILASPSITANSDLVISASLDSGKDNKPVTLKAGAGIDVKVYTFTTKSSVALNGKKTSNFRMDTGTALTVTNVNAVNLEVGEGTTLKLPAKSKFKPASLTGSG